MHTPNISGLYIVRLLNEEPMPIDRDPRRVDTCARVTSANVKVGKTQDLSIRASNYHKVFGEKNALFEPLAQIDLDDIADAEGWVMHCLRRYRKPSPKGRPLEWLEGISYEDAKAAVFRALDKAGIPYDRID